MGYPRRTAVKSKSMRRRCFPTDCGDNVLLHDIPPKPPSAFDLPVSTFLSSIQYPVWPHLIYHPFGPRPNPITRYAIGSVGPTVGRTSRRSFISLSVSYTHLRAHETGR